MVNAAENRGLMRSEDLSRPETYYQEPWPFVLENIEEKLKYMKYLSWSPHSIASFTNPHIEQKVSAKVFLLICWLHHSM